jgi:hypothetical protein
MECAGLIVRAHGGLPYITGGSANTHALSVTAEPWGDEQMGRPFAIWYRVRRHWLPNAEPKLLRRVGAAAILVCWMKRLPKLFAQTVAAVAIALFWCVSAVGTTVTTTLGVTTLATAVNAVTATPAEARRRHRGRGRVVVAVVVVVVVTGGGGVYV